MSTDDWTFLDATIASLDELSLSISNDDVDDFVNLPGQMLQMREDQVSPF